MSTAWSEPQRDPLSWEQYLDLDEDVRRQLEIVDGYVVPREQRDRAHQKVGFRVSAALEQAAVAQMGDYADAGIAHYWIVQLDKLGAVSIERYMLVDAGKPYTHVGTTSRDMGDQAVTATTPFPMEVLWSQLELAPKV